MIIFLTWFPIFATYDIYRSYSVKKSIKNNINPKSTRKSNKNTIKNNNNNSKVTQTEIKNQRIHKLFTNKPLQS